MKVLTGAGASRVQPTTYTVICATLEANIHAAHMGCKRQPYYSLCLSTRCTVGCYCGTHIPVQLTDRVGRVHTPNRHIKRSFIAFERDIVCQKALKQDLGSSHRQTPPETVRLCIPASVCSAAHQTSPRQLKREVNNLFKAKELTTSLQQQHPAFRSRSMGRKIHIVAYTGAHCRYNVDQNPFAGRGALA